MENTILLDCEFCDGKGMRNHNSDGMDYEAPCSFCEGSGKEEFTVSDVNRVFEERNKAQNQLDEVTRERDELKTELIESEKREKEAYDLSQVRYGKNRDLQSLNSELLEALKNLCYTLSDNEIPQSQVKRAYDKAQKLISKAEGGAKV